MPPYGGRVSGKAVCPSCRGVASSEAEARGAVEGLGGEPSSETEIAPRVQGAWMGRTVYVGRVLGFFELFPFFRIGKRM